MKWIKKNHNTWTSRCGWSIKETSRGFEIFDVYEDPANLIPGFGASEFAYFSDAKSKVKEWMMEEVA